MEFKCVFETKKWVSMSAQYNLYMCSVTSADINEPNHTIKEFKGEHEAGKTNADVKRISFEGCRVKYFPRDLHKHFPNLTNLVISQCDLKQISRQDLKGLENLASIAIRNCQLTSLPDDLFVEMPNLRSVSLDKNKIRYATSKVLEPFEGRSDLTVNLSGNAGLDSYYHPSMNNLKNSVNSLEELMKVIDASCSKPINLSNNGEGSKGSIKNNNGFHRSSSDVSIGDGVNRPRIPKSILAMHSPVFAKRFQDDDSDEISFKGFSENVVETLLCYLYNGSINDSGNLIENYEFAAQYELNGMKTLCEKKLMDQIDSFNAFEIFKLAHCCSSEELKQAAFNRISDDLPENLPDNLMENPEKLKLYIKSRCGQTSLIGME